MGLHVRKSTSIFWKTLPFVMLRIGFGLLIGLLAMLYFGLVAGLLYWLVNSRSVSALIALVGLVLAVLLFVGFLRVIRRYALYLISGGHIAVIAHIIETGEVPDSQIAYGLGEVKDNFASASALFGIDQLVKGVIKQFNRTVSSLASWVGFIPALQQIVRFLQRAIALAASYIDEAILAHIFVSQEENNWQAARNGVVLYGKVWKSVLATTVIIVGTMYVVAFIGLLALTPLAGVIGQLSPTYEYIGWAVVAGVALAGYLGFIRPWVKTIVITTFLIESRHETPDSDTADWLESKSNKFSDLMQKAETGEPAAD